MKSGLLAATYNSHVGSQEHVGEREVPMNDVVRMKVHETLNHLLQDFTSCAKRIDTFSKQIVWQKIRFLYLIELSCFNHIKAALNVTVV